MKFWSGLILSAMLLLCSCSSNEIEIEILYPQNGFVVAAIVNDVVALSVRFDATNDLVYETEVTLYPQGDPSNIIISWIETPGTNGSQTGRTVDLSSYGSGARFTMDARACADAGCDEEFFESSTFSLQ